MEGMLSTYHPKRISVDDALGHPFIASLRDPGQERVAEFEPYDTSFEHEELDKPRLQELMWGEMRSFRPSLPSMRFK